MLKIWKFEEAKPKQEQHTINFCTVFGTAAAAHANDTMKKKINNNNNSNRTTKLRLSDYILQTENDTATRQLLL